MPSQKAGRESQRKLDELAAEVRESVKTPAAFLLVDKDNGETLDVYKAADEQKARRVAAHVGGVNVVPLYA
ncbi:hypothetical protein [Pseudomonas sp. AN3A02]|uniref:hypothetical protein n=1 Tax=Pseudomonas sp. AN3A02 TaxID=2719587 RepID=UPI001432061D|nr:hypothetical protein [Pseudomonas sp. AN3A02]NIL19726.1 hypothetical protein [Pseudomonas sp. AN3A02]